MTTATEMIARARARVAELKRAQEQQKAEQEAQILKSTVINIPSLNRLGWKIDKSADWNEQQINAINMGLSHKDFCLIGAAGTGKTTCLRGIIRSLLANELVPILQSHESTKWLKAGTPGIVLCSFTNMAVRQIAKNFTDEAITCITIHKLLEFAPVIYETEDEKGETVKKMVFEPTKNIFNKLPVNLKVIVIDESSMVDIALFDLLLAALPDPTAVQFVFLGDLNQLPPVYGGPILGKKLLELPIVELTQVYRQALESPIISLAIKMKDGLAISFDKQVVDDRKEHGKVTIHPWSKSIHWEDALNKAQNFCKAAIKENVFDIYQDIILCPYNVSFGVKELNAAIADYLGRQRNAVVFEIIAGFETHYYAVGDKVLVQKREAIITKIQRNSKYSGKRPINPEHYEMDRWGGAKKRTVQLTAAEEFAKNNADFDVDKFLEEMQVTTVENRVTACSHELTIQFIDGHNKQLEEDERETHTLTTAAEVNDMLFGYAITVHKSQGSEWRKVFIILHQSHAKMCSRELLYTAITRARHELYIICEPDRGMKAGTLTAAAKKPRLKGNTLAEKLISLKEKFAIEEKESVKQRSAEESDESE